ncbi:MAG: hypothetical protein ABIO24_12930, partial [Saprospiraceae bacterium]
SGRSSAIEQEGTDEQSPEQILLRIRKQLTLMRFYNERLHERPTNQDDPPLKGDSAPGKKGRNPFRFFENLYNRIMIDLGKIKDFSNFKEQEFTDYLYFRYLVQLEKSLFDGFINPADSDQNLMLAMEELDTFYLFSKLHLLGKFINLEKQFRLEEIDPEAYKRASANKDIMILVCKAISEGQVVMKPLIHLLAELISLITERDRQQADLLAKQFGILLDAHSPDIPNALLEEFELHLCNHYTKRFQETRKAAYLLLLHEIHLKQVERFRTSTSGISASQLTNIVFTALKLGLGDWAEETLNLLGQRIIDAKAGLIHSILLAQLLFEQKKFLAASKVLPHFTNYGELKDMNFYVRAAQLDIKICYELNCLLDEKSLSMYKATQIKLKRDTSLILEKSEPLERFFTVVMRLYRAKDYLRQSPNADITKRLQDVWEALTNKNEPVVDADWLEDKWLELRKP